MMKATGKMALALAGLAAALLLLAVAPTAIASTPPNNTAYGIPNGYAAYNVTDFKGFTQVNGWFFLPDTANTGINDIDGAPATYTNDGDLSTSGQNNKMELRDQGTKSRAMKINTGLLAGETLSPHYVGIKLFASDDKVGKCQGATALWSPGGLDHIFMVVYNTTTTVDPSTLTEWNSNSTEGPVNMTVVTGPPSPSGCLTEYVILDITSLYDATPAGMNFTIRLTGDEGDGLDATTLGPRIKQVAEIYINYSISVGPINDTTVVSDSATVDSDTQITATFTFTGDENNDSTTTFYIGPTATGPWTLGCTNSSPGSPRTCVFTGLSAGTTYYINRSHYDPDGTTGANPNVIGPYTTTSYTIAAPGATSVVNNTYDTINISSPYQNDTDGDSSTDFYISTTSATGPWTLKCAGVTGASPRTCDNVAVSSTYWVNVTYTDPDGAVTQPAVVGPFSPPPPTPDSTAPTINSVTDAPDPVVQGQNITFTVNCTDNVGVSTVLIDFNGANHTATGTEPIFTYEHNTSAMAPSTYPYSVYCGDAAGNLALASGYSFTVVPPTSYYLYGYVLNATSSSFPPVSGASVAVLSSGAVVNESTTSATGFYNISGIYAGTYDVAANLTDFGGHWVRGVTVSSPTELNMTLGAPRIYEHRPGGADVATNASHADCPVCHSNPIMLNTSWNYPEATNDTLNATIHYFREVTTLPGFTHNAVDTTKCLLCHYNGSYTMNPDWGYPWNISNPSSHPDYPRRSRVHLQSEIDGATATCQNCHWDGAEPNWNASNFHQASLTIAAAGGPDCVSCHDIGGIASKHVDVSAMKNGVHANLNSQATNTTNLTDSIDKACWGCHNSDGSEPPSGSMGDRKTNPYTCYDCHNGTAPYPNVSNAPTVSEHFKNGQDIQAATGAATVVLSCIECHTKSEMLVPANDPDNGTFDADGDGRKGGNTSYYHYGKPRPDLVTAGGNAKCEYCHQNSSTAFESAMDVNPAYHKSMDNHTDRPAGPWCTDSKCHNGGRIHDSTLTKPGTLFNNTLCASCHTPSPFSTTPEAHGSAGPNANNLFCADCHTNVSAYPAEKQIHGVRYINKSGVYSAKWDETNVADCTTCHQGSLITQINNTPIPKIPGNLNHSDNESAGMIWNTTPGGYLGPWKPSANNINACWYCHGNATEVQHSANALGRINKAYLDNNQVVNGSISSTSYYCSECHYDGNSNRSAMVAQYTAAGLEAPPENTAYTYYNHSNTLASSYDDSKCQLCHGSLLSGAATMDEFVHNVGIGQLGGPDCVNCHDLTGSAPAVINVSALKLSVHANLNNQSSNSTQLTDPVDKACWACHTSDGNEPSDMGDRYANPRTCYDCHNGSATPFVHGTQPPTVYEHFKSGQEIQAATGAATDVLSCIECHEKGEMIVPNNDPDEGSTVLDVDGDGDKGGNKSYYHYGKDRSDIRVGNADDCSYCHQNSSTAFESAMDVNPAYHKNMPDHTDRVSGPSCYQCHGAGLLHDSILSDRAGEQFSNICIGCHSLILPAEEIHAKSGPNANNLFCADCHTNVSAYPAEKQIHGIRYINKSGVYSAMWDETNAADCTTCHQGSLITQINNTPIPKIPSPMNHSNNESAGSLWNNTATGYFGPWQPASNNLRGCLYCHGTVPKSQINLNNLANIIHNSTSLGRISKAYQDNNQVVNGSISSTSYYCSECHYDGNSNRSAMVTIFTNAGFEAPQSNTQNQSGDPSYFFNHTSTLSSGYSDSICRTCHGTLLSSGAKMDEFVHNVAIGTAGGPDCYTNCHGPGGNAPQINFTSFKAGVHSKLNANATNTTSLPEPAVKACWGCHSDGTQPPSGSMGLNKTNPWHCEDCHVPGGSQYNKYNAPTVGAHVPTNASFSSTNLWTNGSYAYCTNCHSNYLGDTRGTTPGTTLGMSLLANTSHYARNDTGLKTETKVAIGAKTYANCTYCHYGNQTVRDRWRNPPNPTATKNHEPGWNASNCGACHYHSLAGTLHDPRLNGSPGGGPSCITCHDIGGAAPLAPKINVSAMSQSTSIHLMLNNRSGTPGGDDTSNWNWNNRRCWACHGSGNSTILNASGQPEGGLHPANYKQPFNCTNCHINGSAGNDVYFVGSPVKNVTNHWDGAAANASRGQDTRQSIYVTAPYAFNDSECIECHNNSLGTSYSDGNDTIASNVSHYATTTYLVHNSGQNCTYCHVQPDGAVRNLWLTNRSLRYWPSSTTDFKGLIRHETNSTHCTNCHGNLSSSIKLHSEELTKTISVHYAFDWEGDDAIENPPLYGPFSNYAESCYACHEGGMFGTGNLKICEDCHLPGGTGPWTYYDLPGNPTNDYQLRSDLAGWNVSDREALGIPVIYAHVPYNSIQNATPPPGQSRGVQVKRNLSTYTNPSGMRTMSSCFSWNPSNLNGTCHGVAYAARFNATPQSEVAQGKAYFMHYGDLQYGSGPRGYFFNETYMNTYIPDYAPRTNQCLWCHNQTNASIRSYWGNAIQIYYNQTTGAYIGPSNMFGATSNSDCYICHTTDSAQPENFHAKTLQPTVSANCLECHDQANPKPGVTHDINVTAFKKSVHRYVNANASISNSSWDPVVKACWGCHNEGGAEGGMAKPRYNNPYICIDCHLDYNGDGIGDGAYANVSDAPKVKAHFTNATDIKASYNTSVVLSCKKCHNLDEMINPSNDTEPATFDADGDGIYGGTRNFYHYGRNRSSDLRVTRNSNDCGGNANTNCSGWNNFPANTVYTYTNCSYCHQTPGNNFTVAMNRSDIHANMLNHTDNANGPYCTDCHVRYDGSTLIRIHDPQIIKPYRSYTPALDDAGMYNSSLCMSCHEQKEVHADSASINTDKLECASCHANASVYTSGYGEKQVHGIRFVNDSGVYSAPWDRTAAANCTTCHMGFVAGNQLVASPSAGVVAIPQIPRYFNHSNDSRAGTKWNETIGGYNGPWKPSANNVNACLYCHGNVPKSQTDANDISNIVHNATALGRVANAHAGTNYVNGTINSTSMWCGACHYPQNSYYSATTGGFRATGFEAPPDNTNESGPEFFNHSGELLTITPNGASDAKCAVPGCHGGLLSANAKMDEFAHNVQAGDITNCILCHDVANRLLYTATINVSAFNSTSVDPGLNDPATVQSADRTLHGDINEDGTTTNDDCRVCHYNTTGMGAEYQALLYRGYNPNSGVDPTNVSSANTYYCTICHVVNTTTDYMDPNYGNVESHWPYNVTPVGNPPRIYRHVPMDSVLLYMYIDPSLSQPYYEAEFTNRTPACEFCHNNSIYYYNGSDSTIKTVVHYGKYRELNTIGTPDSNTTRCDVCHRSDGASDGAAERAKWGIFGYSKKVDGFVGPVPPGDVDMGNPYPGTLLYCWTCHVVTNFDKSVSDPKEHPLNFHAKEVTNFMDNCNLCHAF